MTALTRLNAHRPLRWAALLVALAGSVAVYVLLSRPAPLPPDLCEARTWELRAWNRRVTEEYSLPSTSIASKLASVPFDLGNLHPFVSVLLTRDEVWLNDTPLGDPADLPRLEALLLEGIPPIVRRCMDEPVFNCRKYLGHRPFVTLLVTRDVPWNVVARTLNVLPQIEIYEVEFATLRPALESPRRGSAFDGWMVKYLCDDAEQVGPRMQRILAWGLAECSPAATMLKAAEKRCQQGPHEDTVVAETVSKLYFKCQCAMDEDALRSLLWHYYRRDEKYSWEEVGDTPVWYSIRVGGRAKLSRENSPEQPVFFRCDDNWGDVAMPFMKMLEDLRQPTIRAFCD